MARAPRDWKAVERRRNERAQAAGFPNRATQRRAIESGKIAPLAPQLVRSPKTIAAQSKRLTAPKRESRAKKTEFERLRDEYLSSDLAGQCADWSAIVAATEWAKYRPDQASEYGLTVEEYTAAYYAAFVAGRQRYHLNRHKRGGSPALRHWFVDIMDMEGADYDDRYGAGTASHTQGRKR